MSAHTPGPWRVEGVGLHAVIRDSSERILAVRHRLHGAEWEQNARLIAAAPDLLEALREYVEMHDISLDGIEKVAAAFERETGMLAPFKDVAAAVGETEAQRALRRDRFAEWSTAERRRILLRARAAIAKAEGK